MLRLAFLGIRSPIFFESLKQFRAQQWDTNVPQRGGYEKKGLKPAVVVIISQGCAGFIVINEGLRGASH